MTRASAIPTAANLESLADTYWAAHNAWATAIAERPDDEATHANGPTSLAGDFVSAMAELTTAIVAITPAGATFPHEELDDLSLVGTATIRGRRYDVLIDLGQDPEHRRLAIAPVL